MFNTPEPPYICIEEMNSPLGFALASIIKFPPPGNQDDKPYSELICSEQDVAFIFELITLIADNNKFTLLLKRGHLKQLGAQINHLHPLKFLAAIFKNPRLRSCMNEIENDFFKWSGFMEGLAPNLTKEADKGKLEQYLQDFCTDLKVPTDHIKKYFQNRNWEAMVRYLVNHPFLKEEV